jgi:hypothetical protein
MEAPDVDELRRLLTEAGTRERAEARVAELTSQAKETASRAGADPTRWVDLIDELVAR